jgi:hypothetical protein
MTSILSIAARVDAAETGALACNVSMIARVDSGRNVVTVSIPTMIAS